MPKPAARDALVVAIETSTAEGGVAVGRGGALLGVGEFERGLVHGREVVPRLASLFAELSLSPSRIDAVVVDVGPGSYTGLRVGVATAKALSFATGAACVAVSAFEAVAAAATLDEGESLLTVRDARRGQVYGALFSRRSGATERERDDFAATPEAAAALAPAGAVVVGDGVGAYPSIFAPPRFRVGPAEWGSPRVTVLLRIGTAALERGETIPAEALAPRYLQPSEPERRARK